MSNRRRIRGNIRKLHPLSMQAAALRRLREKMAAEKDEKKPDGKQ